MENMKRDSLDQQVLQYFHELAEAEQIDVLKYVKSLVVRKQSRNQELLKLAGSIQEGDLQRIEQAIAQGCEGVDKDEW